MKKNKIAIYCLSALALLGSVISVTSCTYENPNKPDPDPVDPDPIDPDPTPDPSPDYHYDNWSSEQQELIKKYCGDLIPFDTDNFSKNIKVQEIYIEDYDYYYLEISDVSSKFTIEKYYELLEKTGWTSVVHYNGNKVETSTSGVKFVELTKPSTTDASVGYDMQYFNDSGHNVIQCFNDLTSSTTTATSWSSDDAAIIKDTLTTSLPFINLGSANSVSQPDSDTLNIIDTYTTDLSKTYADLLIKDGFQLDSSMSTEYNSWILFKILEDDSVILAQIYYQNGNGFYFYYVPNVEDHESWPTDIVNEIKDLTGVEIPVFEKGENGVYSTYKKNDTYYIFTESLSDTFDYDEYSYNQLKYFTLSWNETISVSDAFLTDEDYNNYGYLIAVTVTEPTSTFENCWPSETINSTLSSLFNINDVNIPEFDYSLIADSGYSLKYEVQGEEYYETAYEYYYTDIKDYPFFYGLDDPTEEEIKELAHSLALKEEGIVVSFVDYDMATRNEFEKTLINACWYEGYDEYGNTCFEDPEGKVKITFDGYADPSHDYEGPTKVRFSVGSGEEHTPTFAFDYDEYTFAIGTSDNQLGIIKSMLPYDVTFSSSDTTGGISVDADGNVTIDEGVEDGATATITATMLVPGESTAKSITCTVTAKKVTVYTLESAINTIADALKDMSYSGTVINNDEQNKIIVPFYSDTDIDTIKSLVPSLVPEGFEIMGEWCDATIYPDDDTEVEGQMVNYSLYNDYCYIILEYQVYTIGNKTYLTIFAY